MLDLQFVLSQSTLTILAKHQNTFMTLSNVDVIFHLICILNDKEYRLMAQVEVLIFQISRVLGYQIAITLRFFNEDTILVLYTDSFTYSIHYALGY